MLTIITINIMLFIEKANAGKYPMNDVVCKIYHFKPIHWVRSC